MIFVTCLFWADLHLFYSRLPSNIFCCLLSLLYIIAVHSFTAISAHSAPSSSILLMKSKWQDVSWEKDSKYRRKKKQQQLIFPFLRRLFMFGPSCKRTCNRYSQPQTYFFFFDFLLFVSLFVFCSSLWNVPTRMYWVAFSFFTFPYYFSCINVLQHIDTEDPAVTK